MTKQTVRRAAPRVERAWEVVPGILEWTTFTILVLLSWLAPYAVSYGIMMYALYWLIKTAHVNTHLVYTYRKLKKSSRQDWSARLHDLDEPEQALERVEKALATLRAELRSGTFRSRRSIKHAIEALAERRRVLKDLQAREDDLPSWRDVWHVVIFPTYNEPTEVLEESIGALLESKFPLDRVAVVVGIEERAGDAATEKARILKEKFDGKFAHFGPLRIQMVWSVRRELRAQIRHMRLMQLLLNWKNRGLRRSSRSFLTLILIHRRRLTIFRC